VFPIKQVHLRAAGATPVDADRFIDPVNLAMIEFSITTGERPAMFLAQVGHESGGFHYTSELWGPTPAQERYEGRLDLGNTQPGDGERFKGHGLIQVTGRANHAKAARDLGVPFDAIILWLTTPIGASRSAAHYWATHGCNHFADDYDFVALTRAINGGLNGLEDRLLRYTRVSDSMK
jgi:putative chitinase